MALVNRDKDPSEQRDLICAGLGLVATGATRLMLIAPYAAEVSVANLAALGISGSPILQLSISRFNVGAGITNVTGGFTSVALVAVGTSGVQAIPQVASGNTLIQLNRGDLLIGTLTGTTSAVADLEVTLALKCLQDVKSHFGV